VAAVVAAFFPALANEFVNWDDDLNLTGNPYWRGLGPAQLRWMFTVLHGGHYQPLSWVSYALDYKVWGLDPVGYHLTNLVLHAANAVIFWLVTMELLRIAAPPATDESPGAVPLAAAGGALFFALHPLRVESVAWASERRDVLSGLFFLLTVLFYVRAATGDAARRRMRLVVATLWFALSLLSKAWAITLPAVLLVLDAYPLRRLGRGRSIWPVLGEKIPFVVLAGGAAVLAFLAQNVEAIRPLSQHGLGARVAQAAYGLCFYVWKTIVPIGLSPLYLLEMPLDPTEPRYVLGLALVVAAAVGLFLARSRAPWLVAAGACYVLILSPVLGFVQSGQQKVADRYTYLACMPFAVLVAAGLRRVLVTGPGWARQAGAAAAGVVLVGLGTLTAMQTTRWHDSMTLWSHALALDPASYIAWTNRGVVRQLAGDVAGAMVDYDAALAINPAHAEAYKDRGTARAATGQWDAALADYDVAIRLKPGYADAYVSRGAAREQTGDLAGALADYAQACTLDPGHARALYGRANMRATRGDIAGAIADYTHALQINPAYVEAWNNRGLARRRFGDEEGARADFARALAVAPAGWPGRAVIERNLGQ
jgi:Tfp pilus assembly protein PilF